MPAAAPPPAGTVGTAGASRAAGTLRIGSIAGVSLWISVTTVALVGVLAIALVPQIERVAPTLAATTTYAVAIGTGVTIYLAVLVHELAHAIVAQRYGHRVDSITLSLIGGRTVVQGEAASPREEFLTAIAGPLASVVVGGLALAVRVGLEESLVTVVLEVVVLGNLVLGLLDLVPAPPMDGGRLVKAAGWRLTGSARRGSVVAAHGGQVVALLVLVGAVVVLPALRGRFVLVEVALGVVLAALLGALASQELRVARLRLRVGEVVVRDLVRRTLVVPPDVPLAEALRRSTEADAPGLVSVDGAGALLGVLSDTALADIPPERRPWVPVSQAMRSIAPGHRLPIDVTGDELLGAISRAPVAEYVVLDEAGGLVGVLALRDLDRVVRRR